MEEKILRIKNEALSLLIEIGSEKELEKLRVYYLGKKGKVNSLLKELKKLSDEERRSGGRLINELKEILEGEFGEAKKKLSKGKKRERIDITIKGKKPDLGSLHIISRAIWEIEEIFKQIGFTRASYPEVENDWYAFESLNMPENHPARDEWETFFIEGKSGLVLTPHTSSGQVREMEKRGRVPIRMINIAKCYRRQADVSHSQMFHQFEGLVVDKNISIVHLKGTIDYFVKSFFGKDRKSRIRPYDFRFTEPSFEVDVTCSVCKGKGCRLCKEGWLELGGAGMVHPAVLKNGGLDPGKYTGFAFGWGVERTYMMKEGLKVDDIRLLYRNDLRFLKQF